MKWVTGAQAVAIGGSFGVLACWAYEGWYTRNFAPVASAAGALTLLCREGAVILLAGGEEPDTPAPPVAAERAQGVFPARPEAEVAPPPRAGWPLALGAVLLAVLLAVVVAGYTYAALQAAGWLRP